MFCTKCGTKINDGEKFCTGCGIKVELIEKEASFDPVPETENKEATVPEVVSEPVEALSEAHENFEVSECSDTEEISDETAVAAEETAEIPASEETATDIGNEAVVEFAEQEEIPNETEVQDDAETETEPPIIPVIPVQEQTEKEAENERENEDTVPENKNKKEKRKNEKAPKQKPKRKIGIGYRILSFLLCVILFAVMLSTALFGIVRGVFSSETISDCITKIGASEIAFDGESIADIVYDNCSRDALEELGLDKTDVVNIVEAIEFEDVVDGILMPYIDYLLGFSKEVPEIDPKIVTGILEDNKEAIIEATDGYAWASDEDGYTAITKIFSDEVTERIEAQASVVFESISLEEMESDFAVGNVYARILSEKFFYICMIVICVLFGLLVFLANKLRFFRAIGDIGVVAIVVAVLLGIIYVAYTALPLVIDVPSYILSFFNSFEFLLIVRIAAYGVAGIVACVACKIASVAAAKKEK